MEHRPASPGEGYFDDPETSPRTPEGFISIEELATRIEALKHDEYAVLDMIAESAGSIPLPDPEDVEASLEYDRKQAQILSFARERLGRSFLIQEFEDWLESRKSQ